MQILQFPIQANRTLHVCITNVDLTPKNTHHRWHSNNYIGCDEMTSSACSHKAAVMYPIAWGRANLDHHFGGQSPLFHFHKIPLLLILFLSSTSASPLSTGKWLPSPSRKSANAVSCPSGVLGRAKAFLVSMVLAANYILHYMRGPISAGARHGIGRPSPLHLVPPHRETYRSRIRGSVVQNVSNFDRLCSRNL